MKYFLRILLPIVIVLTAVGIIIALSTAVVRRNVDRGTQETYGWGLMESSDKATAAALNQEKEEALQSLQKESLEKDAVMEQPGNREQILQADMQRFSQGDYQAAFLSMFPLDTFKEEDFALYRGLKVMKSSYTFTGVSELASALVQVLDTKKNIDTVYIGIDPEKIVNSDEIKNELVPLLQNKSQITFEILLSFPSMDYWVQKSAEETNQALMAYKQQPTLFFDMQNVTIYFLGSEEWLVCNGGNYIGEFVINDQVARKLMLHTFCDHNFQLSPENANTRLNGMEKLVTRMREEPPVYENQTGLAVVFLGDSIIGNYVDSLSIPEVVRSLSKAEVFNCGYGGTTAAESEDSPICLTSIVAGLIEGDLSVLPMDSQAYLGLKQFQKAEYERLTFVINYGLNDYMKGNPLKGEDPYDATTYSGALRTAVRDLREAYPEAQIILMAPNFTIFYNNGTDVNGERAGKLTDYVDMVVKVGKELSAGCMNNYKDMGINEENQSAYLADGCHLNEEGRYLLGQRIVEKIQESY